jgi:hypothetical protein
MSSEMLLLSQRSQDIALTPDVRVRRLRNSDDLPIPMEASIVFVSRGTGIANRILADRLEKEIDRITCLVHLRRQKRFSGNRAYRNDLRGIILILYLLDGRTPAFLGVRCSVTGLVHF